MSIGIQNITGIKKKEELIISQVKREHDLTIDKIQDDKVEDLASKASCGELDVDVYRDYENLYIIAQIPGIKKNGIKILLHFDVLLLEGERKFPLDRELMPITEECQWGEFRRRIVLPEDVDTTKLKASFENNVLIISIPIIEKAKMKMIEIE
ncbi:hypothetical protein A2335_01560 [Candidatus Peregrinibacteria bacterium RIFOXYB2_FULL_32_7]|nr:MAG: hypothetical protein A2335_01560 [Candidatus Peregrinibacteria bacterium RIFOXYB2_FULL_32_7]